MKQGVNKLDHNAAAIKRWRSRLKRAMSALDKLERQRKRLEAAAIKPPKPVTFAEPVMREIIEQPKAEAPKVETPKPDDNLAIPTFLQRKKLDPVAAEIASQQEATKRVKARGRIDKMKAKRRGDLKRMPLSGKAALDAIRNG